MLSLQQYISQFGNGSNNGFAQHDGQLNNNSFTETLSCHLTGLHFHIASDSGAFQMSTDPSAVSILGGGGDLINVLVTFYLFWHEASLG